MAFLRRHRVAILTLLIWLVCALVAWPRLGRCIWMLAVALTFIGSRYLWLFFNDPESFK